MKHLIIPLLLISSLSNASEVITKVFDQAISNDYKAASLILDENRDKIKVQDEFGDTVDKYDEIRQLIKNLKRQSELCLHISSKTPTSENLGIYKSYRDRIKNDCSINGKLGILYKNINNTYKYDKFLKKIKKLDGLLAELDSKITKLQAEQDKEIKKAKNYPGSIQEALDKACTSQRVLDVNHKVIAKEKAAAKISGYEDKKKLYQAGHAIRIFSKQIEKDKKLYYKKAKRKWSSSLCK